MLEHLLIIWTPMFIKACDKTLISFITFYKRKKIAVFCSAKDKVQSIQKANIQCPTCKEHNINQGSQPSWNAGNHGIINIFALITTDKIKIFKKLVSGIAECKC